MDKQKKSILKTVSILVCVMAVILLLFLNKITTPRYLSDIELRINGLVLIKTPVDAQVEASSTWLLIANSEKEQETLERFQRSLKRSLRKKIKIAYKSHFIDYPKGKNSIAVVNPQGFYIGYVKSPYDIHKMTLTLASVVTHRD